MLLNYGGIGLVLISLIQSSKIRDVACAAPNELNVDQRVHYGPISNRKEIVRSQMLKDVFSKSAYSIDAVL